MCKKYICILYIHTNIYGGHYVLPLTHNNVHMFMQTFMSTINARVFVAPTPISHLC